MKCSNCRCIIPDSSAVCMYCGRRVYLGNEPTETVGYHDRYPYRRESFAPRSVSGAYSNRLNTAYTSGNSRDIYPDKTYYDLNRFYDRSGTDRNVQQYDYYDYAYQGNMNGFDTVRDVNNKSQRARDTGLPVTDSDDWMTPMLVLISVDILFTVVLLLVILLLVL